MHNSWLAVAFGCAFLLSMVDHSRAADVAEAIAATKGRVIAETYCARCHAIAGTHASPVPKAPPFSTLGQRYPIDSLAEAFAEGIVTGHREMPQFTFEPADIDALLSFLSSVQAAGR